jgi:ribosomal protein L11 methyltransferase
MELAPLEANPYQDLYIYYLSGRFRPGRGFQPEHYIGSWEEGEFSFLFFTRPSRTLVESTVDRLAGLELLDHHHMTYDQWQGVDIVPCRIGRFTISPPWFAVGKNNADNLIILDPGVVFGAGTHPTTRDCLEALQLAFEETTIRSALDLGTGTGLLALAAARMGCPKVLAADLTLLAARTAQRNVTLNSLSDRILVVQGDAEKFMDFTSDLVVSNIHYEVMKNLIGTSGFLNKKRFILSGLMRSEAARIESKMAGLPVEIIHRWDQDGIWHTFYGASYLTCGDKKD